MTVSFEGTPQSNLYEVTCGTYRVTVCAFSRSDARKLVLWRVAPSVIGDVDLIPIQSLQSTPSEFLRGILTVRNTAQNNEILCSETLDSKGVLKVGKYKEGAWSLLTLSKTNPAVKAIHHFYNPHKETVNPQGVIIPLSTWTPFAQAIHASDFVPVIKQFVHSQSKMVSTLDTLKDILQRFVAVVWNSLEAKQRGNWSGPKIVWVVLDPGRYEYQIRVEWKQRVPYQPRSQGVIGVPYVHHNKKSSNPYMDSNGKCSMCSGVGNAGRAGTQGKQARRVEDHIHVVSQTFRIPQRLIDA